MFADIHSHMLFGADDGAKTKEDMFALVDVTYGEGTRSICVTPHYHPGYYGNNGEKIENAYNVLKEYCDNKYPDLCLGLGNELHYGQNCLSWLQEGLCRSMNSTRYVLVDFHSNATKAEIIQGLDILLCGGYLPILAHVERYKAIKCSTARELKQKGVLIQVNAQAPFGLFGLGVAIKAKKMLSLKLVDFISSDAHDVKHRPPGMKRCYDYIAKKHGAEYARHVCRDNAVRLIFAKA